LRYIEFVRDYSDIGLNTDGMLICSRCGKQTPAYGNFCMECGNYLGSVNEKLPNDIDTSPSHLNNSKFNSGITFVNFEAQKLIIK
jgi:predicted amidophosphoribosyltransferase